MLKIKCLWLNEKNPLLKSIVFGILIYLLIFCK